MGSQPRSAPPAAAASIQARHRAGARASEGKRAFKAGSMVAKIKNGSLPQLPPGFLLLSCKQLEKDRLTNRTGEGG